MSKIADEYPVLIAGGGLIGLSAAMFLAQHGIASLAIEKLRGGSVLPRAAFFHMRTIELFRFCGIEEEVKVQSEKEFLPEGAIIAMDNLCGKKLFDIIGSLNAGVEAVSPCRRLFITQPGLEPILRRRAERAGAQVLDGHEVIAVKQDANGVTITARDVDSGKERVFRGKYLIGGDGAHSKVRELLDIPFDGRGVFSNSMTIYFDADLWKQVGDKPLSVIYINNPTFGGFFRLDKDCQGGFLCVNTVGDPKTNPEASNPAKDVSEPTLINLVRSGAGIPDLPVKITGVSRWRATSDVARRFKDGRTFLAGDAAHLMPPNGGYGGNTGIHDVHNLAWKMAYVMKGLAGEKLLETYETERRPVGKFTVEQAYTRYVTRTATYLGAKDFEPPAPDFNIEVGYLYNSPAVVAENGDAKVHDDPAKNAGKPGSRAPHVWLERGGKKVSTMDLCGSSFVLLAGPDGGAWCAAADKVAAKFKGVPIEAFRLGADVRETEGNLTEAYGIGSSGAALVRPDGFVAWRATAADGNAEATLGKALSAVLMKA